MNDKKLGITLKYKLLILLTTIPVVSLAIYIFIATRLFENDKIAYVKDSSVAVARSLAIQFKLEVNGFLEKARPIVENFDYNQLNFSETSINFFNKQDRIDALLIYQKKSNGVYESIGNIKKNNQFAESFSQAEHLSSIQGSVLKDGLVVTNTSLSGVHLVISTVIGEKNSVGHVIVIALYRANELYGAFTKSNIYKHFLISRDGQVKLSPQGAKLEKTQINLVLNSTLPEGAMDAFGESAQIISYADTGVQGMKVTAVVDRNEALAAVNVLLFQSLLFFIALIAVTVIIGVISAVKLTSALRELYDATKLIAKGQFDIRVKRHSNDEVGGLAEGFNFMAGEVSRLMVETADKARMAGELETVRTVQETLFPKDQFKLDKLHVVGHFEPASECGGDWWNYSKVGDKLYLWIGDATGHGAPSAMVTSAAKSAATIIEDLPEMTPGRALEIMNKAIHETSKGRILMTFFIACVDTKTGLLTYANASHEPPYLISGKKPGDKVSKKDLQPLVEARGTRLGDKLGAKFNEVTIQLKEGDSILFYTDGIVDLKNKEGKVWGERGFVKSICESASNGATPDLKMAKLKSNISYYRQNTELVDDITLMMCQYGDAA